LIVEEVLQFPPCGQLLPDAAASAKSVPVPDSATAWGLPEALSVIESVAARAPIAAGVNVTLMVHFALAASVAFAAGHVFVCEKSPLFVPLIAMLEIVSGAVPLFVSVTLCAVLAVVMSCPGKGRGLGDKVTAGATPVPVKLTVCGLFAALSVIETDALFAPTVAGVNVTLILQEAFTARLAPQVFVSENSPLLVPVIAMLEIANVTFPVFVTVTVCSALLVPTS
jgi:hypothetical protein